MRRVSSTTSTRPVAVGLAHDVLDRQRRQPAQVEHPARDPSPGEPAATRRLIRTPLPKVTIGQVVARRRGSAPGRSGRGPRPRPPVAPYGASHAVVRPRAGRGCGRARSARGTRDTLPSTVAAATQVRSIGGGVVGPGRRGDDQAGDVAQHRDRVVVVEVAAEALLVAVAGDAHDHRVAVLAAARRTAASPPRRAAGPRRCAGRPGTGSPGSAAAHVTPGAERQARGWTARRAACRTPARRPAFLAAPGSRRTRRPWRDVLAEDQRLAGLGEDVARAPG